MGASADEREALLGPEEARRGASSDRLKQAQRACADTEELGMSILDGLRSQRETLERSKQRLNGSSDSLARGSRLLRTMSIRASANKMITAAVGTVAGLALLILLCWR